MRSIKLLTAAFLAVFLSVSQFNFQSQGVCRRVKVSELLTAIPPAATPVVDALDGVVSVKIRLATPVGSDAYCDASLTAFLRALSYNRDISVTAIEVSDSVTAFDIAEVLQSNNSLGPWKGVSVTSVGNEIVIRGNNSEMRIPVVNFADNVKADVLLYIGDFVTELNSNPSAFNAQRMLLAPTGVSLLNEFVDSNNLNVPGETTPKTTVISLSEASALAMVLDALENELGAAYLSRADLFLPQGDFSIRPGTETVDLSYFLSALGYTNTGAKLNITEVSGLLQGARRLEATITLPGEVTVDDLKEIFNTTSGFSVAAESASTSGMFNNPYDTSIFILDAKRTQLSSQADGSTRVTLRGWVGDYSMAGMLISSITQMGRELSELGKLSGQSDLQLVYPNVEYAKPQILNTPKTVMINGAAGRIGLNILRSLIGDPNFNVVAVNGVRSAEALRQGLLYDEILGPTNAKITTGSREVTIEGKDGPENVDVEYVEINGKRMYVFNSRRDDSIKGYMSLLFKTLGISVEYLFEASGNYTTAKKLQPFFDANIGIKHAFISAPAKDDTLQVVPGVNVEQLVQASQVKGLPAVLSAGSCTTNNTAPAIAALLKLLEGRSVSVNSVELVTVHAVTQTQAQAIPLQIRNPEKAERQRAGVLSTVPTSTGAAKVLPKIIKGIDSISGVALRVGNPCGSESQLTFHLDGFSPLTKEEIIEGLRALSKDELRNIIFVNEGEMLNSYKINGVDITSIIEASTVDIVPIFDGEGNHVSDSIVFNTWYDNEWSFTQQYLRLITMAALLEENPGMTADELFARSDRLGEHAYVPSN